MATILIIDDDRNSLYLLKVVLERYGYGVTAFSRAKAALAFLQTASPLPDMIVLDIYMPDMDGCTFLEQLNVSPRTASVPVIITTAAVLWDCKELVVPLGPYPLVVKPFDIQDLLTAIREFGVVPN